MRLNFYDCIGDDQRVTFKKRGVVPIAPKDVHEFKNKNKFIYSLKESGRYYEIQSRLLDNFFPSFPLNSSATAFIKSKSYLNFLEPHLTSYFFLRLDLRNFFHSISETMLNDNFSHVFKDKFIDQEEEQSPFEAFINLVTYIVPETSKNIKCRGKRIVPIGFKTSPTISNIIFRKMDILIQKFCSTKGILYTRYADDMLFSSTIGSRFVHADSFISEVSFLLYRHGFIINKKKTIAKCHTISLNGYVIEGCDVIGRVGTLRISNKKTKIIEKTLYKLRNNDSAFEILKSVFGINIHQLHFRDKPHIDQFIVQYCRDQLLNKLTGYRAYIISIVNFHKNYDCINNNAVDKYLRIIEVLNSRIDQLAREKRVK